MKLEGRVAIVTGAASGMGRAVSLRFAAEGAAIACADINDAANAETAAMIAKAGGRTIAVHCDTSQSLQVQAMVKQAVAAFGKVTHLYNNAAIGKPNPPVPESVAELPEDFWRATLDINLTGYFLCAKYALPEIIKAGGGVILNVSSTAGLMTGQSIAAYTTTKTAIIALTRSMAIDYARKGVRVNAICPGPIETVRTRIGRPGGPQGDDRVKLIAAQVPLGRLGKPEDVAALALFLASDDAAFITGAAIPIDGGRTLGVIGGGAPA